MNAVFTVPAGQEDVVDQDWVARGEPVAFKDGAPIGVHMGSARTAVRATLQVSR